MLLIIAIIINKLKSIGLNGCFLWVRPNFKQKFLRQILSKINSKLKEKKRVLLLLNYFFLSSERSLMLCIFLLNNLFLFILFVESLMYTMKNNFTCLCIPTLCREFECFICLHIKKRKRKEEKKKNIMLQWSI